MLSSLSNRIFLASAFLAVLSIAVAVFVVNRTLTARAEAELENSLEEAGTLVEQFQALLFEHLVREARLVADLPKLKAAVYENHRPTVEPLAADYRTQIDADLFLVTNRNGLVLGLAGDPGVPLQQIGALDNIQRALTGQETVAFWPRREGLLQVVSVPIFIDAAQPEILGTLSAGVSFDRRLADQIKRITRSEVVFARGRTIQASTLPDQYRPQLAAALDASGVTHIVLGQEEFVAVRRRLTVNRALAEGGAAASGPGAAGTAGTTAAPSGPGGPGQQAAPPSIPPSISPSITPPGTPAGSSAAITSEAAAQTPVALILRSRTEHLRFLAPLHFGLVITAIFAVIIATLLSYAVARTITRPLGVLTTTMREMAATGDLTRVPPPETGGGMSVRGVPSWWEDEDARVLTGTFRSLTESLARFQREAAQREKLSSLGRLSTVVAHEVRNPLMIIKASLRTLRRASETPEATGAIDDIEGEVMRLDRLVNEVLDYARPIRFDYERTDINALCRDAAAAAVAGHPGSLIAVEAGEDVGELTTDPERLRLVLVNVLANARDAVLQADGPDAGGPAKVRLRTVAGGGPGPGAGAGVSGPGGVAGPAGVMRSAGIARSGDVAWGGAAAASSGVPGNVGAGGASVGSGAPGSGSGLGAGGPAVHIIVTDQGRGIAPEDLARVFDPFFTTKRTGSGLGLAIAKNIVDGLGGSITVASDPPRGTTVHIILPRSPETRAVRADAPSPAPGGTR